MCADCGSPSFRAMPLLLNSQHQPTLGETGTRMAKTAVIIGAGPAGLTAGLELLRRTDIVPVILEASDEIGGISRTIRYKGNRMDIGGHRFFSKSDRVMQWWMELMPPDLSAAGDPATGPASDRPGAPSQPAEISYQGKRRVVTVPARLHEEPPLRGLGPLHHTESAAEEEDSGEGRAEDAAETVMVRSRPTLTW